MSDSPLPVFRYHPSPLDTGSVAPSSTRCLSCDQIRGYIYLGPVYAVDELVEVICPWCIADGSAHIKFNAEFVAIDGVGDYGNWDTVPRATAEEVAFRTPGFSGWQQARWYTCCGDAAAFIGHAGKPELDAMGAGVRDAIRAECGISDADWPDYLSALSRDGSPTAYVFKCLACKGLGGYSDCD